MHLSPLPAGEPGRQGGLNFAGLHYTLHRHYDPVLMRFTGPDPVASPFYNLHHYTGNSPARFFDPDGLFELELFSIGDTKIGISTEGYGKRLKETAVGAAVGGWDAVTLGMHLDDDDKRGIAESYGVDASSGYFAAGMIAGNMTVSVAFGVASGGLAGATCVGRAASVARVVGNAMKGAMAAGEAVEVGGAALEYAETGEWSMRQTMALVGLAGNVGGYALGKVFHPKCFVAGTQVLTMDESGAAAAVAIETIEAGDLVWSRCEHTGEEGFKVVVETYLRETDELVHLSYRTSSGTDTLIGTAEHPFWSLTQNGWVDMGELKVGERLSLTSGTATVTALRTETLAEPVKVYNFQVADWHTYYAAPEADKPFVWVHNANYGQKTTVIGRMDDIGQERFAKNVDIDSWAKSGRIPGPADKPVTWAENKAWLDARIARGDKFALATDPSALPDPRKLGSYVPGKPNGFFTARELDYLRRKGVAVENLWEPNS